MLITRLSAIGDCVLTIPLAVKMKELWPECHVTWIVDCAAAQLLEDHPAVDEVLRIEKRWLAQSKRWRALRHELRNRQFDIVFDPQGLSKSALLGSFSGAKVRVSFDYSQSREIAPLLANCRIHRSARHMVDSYLQLLSPWCAIPLGAGQFSMPVYANAASRVEVYLQETGLNRLSLQTPNEKAASTATPWMAINVGAGWPSKQWPPERYGRIAQEVFQKFGLHSLVLWAGDNEQALADQVVEHSAGSATVAPATTLPELLELIRRAELLISADTAALQIASAVKTPCVGLFGPTWADEVGPYGNKHVSVQSTVLPDVRRGIRRSSNSSMNAIEISEVLRACDQLLAPLAATPTWRLNSLAA